MQIVFITSPGHSGSTLLDMLIGSQPGGFSLGELVLLPAEVVADRPCTCGSPIRQCPVWQPILARTLGVPPEDIPEAARRLNLGWMPTAIPVPGLNDGSYTLRSKLSHLMRIVELKAGISASLFSGAHFREGMKNTARMYEAVAAATGADLLVNSTKHYLDAIENYLALPGRVKLIDLHRDGRAVYASFIRHGFDPARAVDAWRHHFTRGRPLFRRWVKDEDIFEVSYEGLAERPEQTIGAVMQFLGRPFDPARLDLSRNTFHNVNGNDARFRRNVSIRLDERWRRELSAEQLELFARKAGHLNASLGYAST